MFYYHRIRTDEGVSYQYNAREPSAMRLIYGDNYLGGVTSPGKSTLPDLFTEIDGEYVVVNGKYVINEASVFERNLNIQKHLNRLSSKPQSVQPTISDHVVTLMKFKFPTVGPMVLQHVYGYLRNVDYNDLILDDYYVRPQRSGGISLHLSKGDIEVLSVGATSVSGQLVVRTPHATVLYSTDGRSIEEVYENPTGEPKDVLTNPTNPFQGAPMTTPHATLEDLLNESFIFTAKYLKDSTFNSVAQQVEVTETNGTPDSLFGEDTTLEHRVQEQPTYVAGSFDRIGHGEVISTRAFDYAHITSDKDSKKWIKTLTKILITQLDGWVDQALDKFPEAVDALLDAQYRASRKFIKAKIKASLVGTTPEMTPKFWVDTAETNKVSLHLNAHGQYSLIFRVALTDKGVLVEV